MWNQLNSGIKWWIIFVFPLLAWLLAATTGCNMPQTPETRLTFDPWTHSMTFHDTKDNDVLIEGAEYDGVTRTFKLQKLTLRNNASDVVVQHIEEMKIWNEQMRTANQGITNVMSGLTNMLSLAAQVVGGSTVSSGVQTPLGGGSTEVKFGKVTTPPLENEPARGGRGKRLVTPPETDPERLP